MRYILIAAAIVLGAAATPAAAGERDVAQSFAGSVALDNVETSYVRHTREHRMWEIQRNLERQQRRGYRDGYDRGPRYDRGYGPPPHARAYGRRDRDRYYNRY